MLIELCALSNKALYPVFRAGHSLVICEVLFRNPQRAERSKRENNMSVVDRLNREIDLLAMFSQPLLRKK